MKPGVVTITSATPAGAFYATQTIRQLLPPAIFREATVSGVSWTMPAVAIVDRPRFSWRGMHLDVSRHFMPKEFVKKYIDLLALHKMNSFHWHLTDDQGWRIEIKKYPRLTEVGAWREQTLVGHVGGDSSTWVYDKKPHGGFYTQDDVREIVAYARERFVRIVPEIEMPGHSQAAIAAYPSLGNFGDTVSVWGSWGVSPYILNPSDTTIAFMQDVLTEVMALFPGDVHSRRRRRSDQAAVEGESRARRRACRELGLKDEDELQSWFITQMDAFLTSQGRRLVGWDEILEGGLAPNAVVMSWRGTAGRSRRGARRTRRRHDARAATPTSITINLETRSSSRSRSADSCRSIRSTRTSPCPPSSSRSSSSTSSARRARCGRSTSKGQRTSSTWRSRASPRSPKCCGRRRTSRISPISPRDSFRTSTRLQALDVNFRRARLATTLRSIARIHASNTFSAATCTSRR